MINSELIRLIPECINPTYYKSFYTDVCPPSKLSQIISITQSIDLTNKHSFSFYDFEFMENESLAAESFITNGKFVGTANYGEMDGLEQNLNYCFKKAFESNTDKDFIVSAFEGLIYRYVDNIILSSGYETATVEVRVNDNYLTDLSDYTGWHIDKSITERINAKEGRELNIAPYFFVYSPVGPSTIFHDMNSSAREIFYSLSNEQKLAWNYDRKSYDKNKQIINELFNFDDSFTTTNEQGAVFLTGHDSGAIHTSPNAYMMDRVFVIVHVGGALEMEMYKESIYDLYQ